MIKRSQPPRKLSKMTDKAETKSSSTPSGNRLLKSTTPAVNPLEYCLECGCSHTRHASDCPETPAYASIITGVEAERLLGIIAALRCTENLFDPMPARKKHDAIFKQHDEFLLTFIDRYPNHFDKYVWEHIRPPEDAA